MNGLEAASACVGQVRAIPNRRYYQPGMVDFPDLTMFTQSRDYLRQEGGEVGHYLFWL